jgi:hypothetical protein
MSTETKEVTFAASPIKIKDFVDSVMEKHNDIDELRMDRYGFGAWSYSKASMLRKCPLQFYLQYVLKAKIPSDIGGRKDSLSADVGSAGHRVLELVMLGKTMEVAFATTKKEFVPAKLTEEQWAEKVLTMEMSVMAFKDRMDAFSRRNPIRRVFTEMRIGVTKDWEACAFFDNDAFYRGIVDLALQLENGDLVILDHKTAEGFVPTSTKIYDEQLNSYKPLFHYGISPVNGSQAGIHFIRAGDVKMGQYHSKEDIEGKLRTEVEWNLSGNVDRVAELGYFKHECGTYCKWCDWAPLCKAKEKFLKPLELDTKRVIPIKPI